MTDFDNQVVVDWETQGKVSFYNLEGKSYAKSLQVDLEYEFSDNLYLKSTYKNYDVMKQYKSGFLQNPLTPKNRFFTNIEASTITKSNGSKWKFDLTYNWVGKQRIPKHNLSLVKGFSNSYSLLNSQITKVFSKKFELYVGGENMSNYKQDKPVLGGYPFGTDFDTSIVYAPIHGSLFYIGLRLKS